MSELTPYLAVHDARAAIAWYVEHLGAEVTVDPIVMPDGRVGTSRTASLRANPLVAGGDG